MSDPRASGIDSSAEKRVRKSVSVNIPAGLIPQNTAAEVHRGTFVFLGFDWTEPTAGNRNLRNCRKIEMVPNKLTLPMFSTDNLHFLSVTSENFRRLLTKPLVTSAEAVLAPLSGPMLTLPSSIV